MRHVGASFAVNGNAAVAKGAAISELALILSNAGLRTAGYGYALTTSGTVGFTGIMSSTGASTIPHLGRAVTSVTGNANLGTTSWLMLADATSGAIQINLPSSSIVGRDYLVIKTDTSVNTVTVKSSATGSINGVTNGGVILSRQFEWTQPTCTVVSPAAWFHRPAVTAGSVTLQQNPGVTNEFTYASSNVFTLTQVPATLLGVAVNGVLLQASEYGAVSTALTVSPVNHTFVSGDIVRALYLAAPSTSATTLGDIEITDPTRGIILQSPDGSRWRVTIDNTGALIRTKIS